MLYNSKRKKLCRHLLAGGALCLAGLAVFSCSDTYDLDSEQPSGLNTIYGYMKDKGNFKNFLHLMDDLGQTEILSKTGSKTLFVADDDAFAAFYASNDWGVTSYSQLTDAQKKLLLYSAMIDNPYPTSMLSTAEGPVKGEVCRRSASLSVFDSVQVISTYSDELPQNERWTILRATHPEIVLFKDASGAAPMIHFTPKFLGAHQIPSEDVDFLYNDPAGTRKSDDTYVNNAKILESEFCKNGFIHVVDRVITPLDNMAEIIRKNPQTTIFSSILERFAAPADSSLLTNTYNMNKGTDVDSVYVKRYFSDRSWGSGIDYESRRPFARDKDGNTFEGSLKYDPGWNTFVPEIFNNRTPMMEDMGVMLVPTDEAMIRWWNGEGGSVIKNAYGTLENTPSTVLDDLLNVNMLNSLIVSVPSRFADVLDDANLPLGIKKEDVEKVYLGCNGAVYITNKVFAPSVYSSVLFPSVIDTENLNILENMIRNREYNAYLNSMVSTYSFFMPTNQGLLTYVDPVSFGQAQTKLWEFHYDASKTDAQRVWATVYPCEWDGTKWVKSGDKLREVRDNISPTSSNELTNHIEDMLDNIIGLEKIVAGKKYYLTKGKNFIRVDRTSTDAQGNLVALDAAGTLETELGTKYDVKETYNMTNGQSFILDGVLGGTRKSTIEVLEEHEEFSEFHDLLLNCGLIATGEGGTKPLHASVSSKGNLVSISKASSKEDQTFSMLNAHHYTIYAPTNDAMHEAYAQGLPTFDDLKAAEAWDAEQEELAAAAGLKDFVADSANHVREVMRDFVKYHIQSNSIYVDEGFSTGENESMKIRYIVALDDETNLPVYTDDGAIEVTAGSPYRIYTTAVSSSGITLRDFMGNTAQVITKDGLYNLQAREYWLDQAAAEKATKLENSSSLVIHAIDHPLRYAEDQFTFVAKKVVAGENVKRRK